MSIDRVVVVGASATGSVVGGLLATAGVDVVFVARGGHAEAMRDHGLRLRTADHDDLIDVVVHESPANVSWRAGDLVVLATTLADALAALGELRAAAGESVPVACLTAGLQGEVWAASSFDRILSTLVWIAAAVPEPGVVELYSRRPHGVLDTGGDRELAEELSRLLRAAGFDAERRGDIRQWKAAAWVVNLGGAAQALVDGDWPTVVEVARREGERVLARAKVERVSMSALLARVEHVSVEQVAGRVRGSGSTWQPQHPARPLESPWIEGAVAALAEDIGTEAPVNRLLATMAAEDRRLPSATLLTAASPLDRDVTIR